MQIFLHSLLLGWNCVSVRLTCWLQVVPLCVSMIPAEPSELQEGRCVLSPQSGSRRQSWVSLRTAAAHRVHGTARIRWSFFFCARWGAETHRNSPEKNFLDFFFSQEFSQSLEAFLSDFSRIRLSDLRILLAALRTTMKTSPNHRLFDPHNPNNLYWN